MSAGALGDLRLAALWMRRSDHWVEIVGAAAKMLGFRTYRNRDRWLDILGSERWRGLPGGGCARDGWRLRRVELTGSRVALGICPKHTCFDANGREDRRPQAEILGSAEPPKWPLEERRKELTGLLDSISERCSDSLGLDGPVALEGSRIGEVTLHGNSKFAKQASLRHSYEQHGFLDAERVDARVCGDAGVGNACVTDYKQKAEDAFRKCRVTPAFGLLDAKALTERLSEIDSGESPVKRRDTPVVFVLSGKRTPPSDAIQSIMSSMDRHRLPWRRAYADDPRLWSVSDQMGSLLQAAGGHPHTVRLPAGDKLPWSVGIDLSRRERCSRVAAVLVDADGRLVGAWTCDQRRGEVIARKVLRSLIAAAANAVPEQVRESGLLVVRDGRVPEPENAGDYRRLGPRVTLVEFRKGRNPPLVVGSDVRAVTAPVTGWLPEVGDGFVGFLLSLRRNDTFGQCMKIRVRRGWDGMNLGRERVAEILYAQTRTPGLGLRERKLPAPIYWADGIAGASDTDLRFRGQHVVEHLQRGRPRRARRPRARSNSRAPSPAALGDNP